MMLSFSHQLLSRTLKYNTHNYFSKNWIQHRRQKQHYTSTSTREDASIKEGKMSYIDVLNKYTVTYKEDQLWQSKTKWLDKISDGIWLLAKVRDDLFKRSSAKSKCFSKENYRLFLEVKENNKLIQKLERRQKRYIQAIEMYNCIIAECEGS